MSSCKFFVMCKPDCCERKLTGEVISRFEKRGFKLIKAKYLEGYSNLQLIKEHYSEHIGKSFYEELKNFTVAGDLFAMIWEGNIQVAGTMIGATLPWEALPGTIRGDYSCTLPANLVHCSDSLENANREVSLWQNMLN
jgi:nucleoside-diphosphate kinase